MSHVTGEFNIMVCDLLFLGSYDFLGLNFYSANYVTPDVSTNVENPSYYDDKDTKGSSDPKWLG